MKNYAKIATNKFLHIIEKVGNALPHPATLFAIFALIILIVSFFAFKFEWTALNPISHQVVEPVNLLTKRGVHKIITDMVQNFTSFAPLGIVLVAMLGIGVAEDSGLINALIRRLIISTPKKLITFVIVFTGAMSNIASDAGHVIIIPLAGIIFLTIGRHPIVGMAAAFAGVSGCYSANMLLGTIDPLLAGLSTEAAHIIDPFYEVNPTDNYYFMAVSTVILSFTGTWVTEKIVAPRFGEYKNSDQEKNNFEKLNQTEKKGLRISGLISIVFFILILWGIIPKNGFFRGTDGSILNSPLIKGIISLLFIYTTVIGVVYGFVTKKYKNDTDVINGMSKSIKTMSLYIVLCFFASQFVAFFKMSNLAVIFAINGANMIQKSGLGVIPLSVIFIIFTAFINLFMGSASAKWAIMAPIFIPIFMLAGYSPEFTQVIYRIGDSVTNIISPMLSFFALINAFIQKYDSKSRIGTVIATMLPYSIVFFIVWTGLLIIWIYLGFNIGPGAGIYYKPF